MTVEQFWFDDPQLLKVYYKKYIRNLSYTAWLNGYYNYIAQGVVMERAFSKNSKAKYPDWQDPFINENKPKLTKENLEKAFRQQQIEQNDWLFGKK